MSEPFQPIPHDLLKSGFRGCVHVEGWNPACVFRFIKVTGIGEYLLQTPKTKRTYFTGNRLLYTRGNTPSLSFVTTPPATQSPRSQPGATIGPHNRRADAVTDAARHATSLEIDHQSHSLLASKNSGPDRLLHTAKVRQKRPGLTVTGGSV